MGVHNMDMVIKNPYMMLGYIWLLVFYLDMVMVMLESSSLNTSSINHGEHPLAFREKKNLNHLLDKFNGRVSFDHF
jgi:hypothetical protein